MSSDYRSRSEAEPLASPPRCSAGAETREGDAAILIDGWPVNLPSSAAALREIVAELERSPASFLICTLNMDHLVKLRSDCEFRLAYQRARYITADGFPIVLLARFRGIKIERTTGSDLVVPLCQAAARKRYSIYLVGSTVDALTKAAKYLTTMDPDVEIAGMESPPLGFNPKSDEALEIARRVGKSGARLCLVALGAPAQEVFSARALSHATGVAFLGVGASIDFLAGAQRRSPRVLQMLNLEWAWRLAMHPRRLWLRYFRCAILFFILLWGELKNGHSLARLVSGK